MLVLLRNLPRSCVVSASSRRLASTLSEEQPYTDYKTWLQRDGARYQNPERPRNWIGDQVPFPLNPTFKPPAPVSDALKAIIYEQYMENPTKNSARSLAALHGLSIKRVDAILRLKGLEQHWVQNKPLQTGFQAGMEEILGVKTVSTTNMSENLGENASAADLQADDSGNDAARTRYQRMFWEPTAETKSPIVPELLDSVRERVARHQAALHPAAKAEQIHILEREGRANIQFIDIGDQLVNKKTEQRRLMASERRSSVRARRHARKVEALLASRGVETA